ncbi:aminotransferase class III-fold pyridoxal phosphate-dependent enzyme [Paenibacillus polysaccharolyticus]|uniref:aspartate aminotransferase family protein n=1 Tax=Paenibacillus polysaccharolyticus TaxID=582692 RepID=UPI001649CB6E|nr:MULTISPECIES: aminotransferase class III-fold pyridoxal phosphate-dependent enzyme [Paenibacillus]MCM3133960.1 aminotransferase class III-fold pyridoxal phosphate-dependent enzyme [Paenibacillus polysaccharolyticus]MDP9699289.1 glutamate-1-semialdehyde 2,1-aminomutase [Paenibacillus intestini]
MITTNMMAYNQRVKQHLPGGVHYNFHLPWEETPLHFAHASRSRVTDMNGREYLDLYARFGALIVGHGNEEYNECLKDTIDRVLSVSHCDLDAEALELIHQYVPSAEMIRFGLSGTEIVQNALRLARAWTGKNRFVRFEGHYHGNSDNIMGGKTPRTGLPVPSDYPGDMKGTQGRARDVMESQSYLLPWNDAARLEELFVEHGDDIAAVIMEPVCVNGGGVMPAPGYLQRVRQLCDHHQVVLIFDEIITGFRMGLGGAQEMFGVTPDLTTLGKAIAGGGVPVSALVGRADIMKLLVDKKVIHAGTFNGYPLGTAAVKATLEMLGRNGGEAMNRMNLHAEMIHDILTREAAKVGLPLVVQGPAGCASYHCCTEELSSTADYTFELMSFDILLNGKLAEHGILVSTLSRMYPNIMLDMKDVAWFSERVPAAIAEMKELYDELV